jgi:hypothetical protein
MRRTTMIMIIAMIMILMMMILALGVEGVEDATGV